MTSRSDEGIYYILEHPTRGMVTDIPYQGPDEKYHFAWSIPRNDDKVHRFYNRGMAIEHKKKVQAQVGPNHEVVVRRSVDWEAVG